MSSISLFSYIVVSDSGFAPNPFHGFCTLACCKPKIRCAAAIDDWVIGLTPKKDGHKLLYAMKVEARPTIAEYWRDKRYRVKRPDFAFQDDYGWLGDNIYEPLPNGAFRQHRSRHSSTDPVFPPGDPRRYTREENGEAKTRDLSGKRVLVATEFVYFGAHGAIELPVDLRNALAVGIGHKKAHSATILDQWLTFFSGLPKDVQCAFPQKGSCLKKGKGCENTTGTTRKNAHTCC